PRSRRWPSRRATTAPGTRRARTPSASPTTTRGRRRTTRSLPPARSKSRRPRATPQPPPSRSSEMSVTSANINDLQTFVTGSKTTRSARRPDYSSCNTKANAVIAACPQGDGYYVPSNAPSMGAVKNLLDTWRQNEVYVREIRQDLIDANPFDGNGNAT